MRRRDAGPSGCISPRVTHRGISTRDGQEPSGRSQTFPDRLRLGVLCWEHNGPKGGRHAGRHSPLWRPSFCGPVRSLSAPSVLSSVRCDVFRRTRRSAHQPVKILKRTQLTQSHRRCLVGRDTCDERAAGPCIRGVADPPALLATTGPETGLPVLMNDGGMGIQHS
jgi:hypothetical protein